MTTMNHRTMGCWPLIVATLAACSSPASGPMADVGAPTPDGSTAADTGSTSLEGGALAGDTGPSVGPPRVPQEHRAQAVACQPTVRGLPDGGGQLCSSDAECAGDGGALFAHCVRGRCSFDECLSDSDCQDDGVCGCSSDYYGGNGAYHPNVCVPANCHSDGDCGAGGYCTPNRGRCGVFEGFYCHRPTDACYNASECPASIGVVPSCRYTRIVGAFVCDVASVCNG